MGAAAASPIPNALTYLFFRLFGTGIGSMNLVPLFFSLILWLALWRLSSREFPEAQALFFLFLALNYPFGSFSRINDEIMPMTFFVLAALLFYIRAWDRAWLFFPASLLFACSFLSKGKIIYFLLVVLPLASLLILIERGELRALRLNAVRLAWFAGGALLAAVPWYVLLFRRYPAVFRNVGGLNAEHMFPKNIGQAMSFWVLKPPFSFYSSNQVLTIVLFFALAALLLAAFRRNGRPRVGALEIVCVVWTVAGLGLHAFIGYRPVRHYIEFTIPILVLVCLFLSRLRSGLRVDLDVKRKGWVFAGLSILFVAALSSAGRALLSVSPLADFDRAKIRLFFFSLLAALALAAAALIILSRLRGRTAFVLPRAAGTAAILAVVFIYGAQNIARLAEWLRQPSYNLRTIGRDLGAAFPDGVFSGLLVPSLSLENRNAAHSSWPQYANDSPDFLKRAGVTHLFLGTYNSEPAYYERMFPEEMSKARLVAEYRMWRSWFLLCDLRPEASPPSPGTTILEAEAMSRDLGLPGMPRFDAKAGGRFAVRVEAERPALVGRDTLDVDKPGRFRGVLVFRAEKAAAAGLLIQVRLFHEGAVAVERRFRLPAAPSPSGDYVRLPFAGEFMESGPYAVEVRSSGAGTFWFDRLEIIR